MPPRAISTASADTVGTPLANLEQASLGRASSVESGFRLLPSADFAFDARLALARRAQRTLDVQYYQIQRDGTGLRFLRELRDAAARGVRVRVLVDDLYTTGEDELFRSLAALPNVEVRLFNPLPARGATLAGRLIASLYDFGRINRRMHNKLFVADNRFAVSGGRNMADEYFMRSRAANFIDMDVLSTGPVVRELSAVFDNYWNSQHAYPVEAIVGTSLERDALRRRFDELAAGAAPDITLSPKDPFDQQSVESEMRAGRVAMRLAPAIVFADSPMKIDNRSRGPDVSTVTRSVLASVATAQSEVVITSPYFIPGPIGLAMMKDATEHHVEVDIFTNSLGATDEPLVHWRYAHYRRDLLRMGVKIYELSPDLVRSVGTFGDFGKSFGRLHAKVLVIDRRQLIIGSMNFDERSAWTNTEAGLLIESPELAEDIRSLVGRDRHESVYQLRMAADDETLEWVTTNSAGKETVLLSEPHSYWLLRLKLFLLEPFASEELL